VQSFYPEQFERDMACTEAEWLGWLPRAVDEHACERQGATARVTIGQGRLVLTWEIAPPRAIALMRLPRLKMRFVFSGLDESARYAFMKRFDLYTQRGGG
jgi:hypothetical protein